MAATETTTDVLLAAFENSQASAGSTWLHVLRAEALDAYRAVGLPNIRHEEWRYSPLTSITKHSWRVAPTDAGATLRLIDIAHYLPVGMEAPRLVFVNGRFNARLSFQGRIVTGLHCLSLQAALESKGPSAKVVQAHLARHAEIEGEAFTALNTAFFEDGAFVHVERGVALEQPIQILHMSVGSEAALGQPRSLVVLDEGSTAQLIEIQAGIGQSPHLSNSVCEIVVGERANLSHVLLQHEDNAAVQINMHRARVDKGGVYASRVFSLGAALTRNNAHCVLNGEGAEATLGGLFLGRGTQHLDNHVYLEHAKPLGTSRQLYRGVLDEKSRGVFSGKVVVRPGAQKTDAQQQNNNLLLSDDAQIDTKPQLEIYADDVKCSHGATSGKLNEEALFFLRSRGLAEKEARSLLTYAFCAELIEAVKPEKLRDALAQLVQARFQ
jgi:Fe-S cluster assembly protein SufD